MVTIGQEEAKLLKYKLDHMQTKLEVQKCDVMIRNLLEFPSPTYILILEWCRFCGLFAMYTRAIIG